jgi:hypothetical protein
MNLGLARRGEPGDLESDPVDCAGFLNPSSNPTGEMLRRLDRALADAPSGAIDLGPPTDFLEREHRVERRSR